MIYSLEGNVTTRFQPELLVGQYALSAVSTSSENDPAGLVTLIATGPQASVQAIADSWQPEAAASAQRLQINYVGSREEAEAYTPATERPFVFESEDVIDLEGAIKTAVPTDHELLVARLELWRERRVPSSRRYVASRGKLLGIMGFDLENGWHEPHVYVQGTRTSVGLVTPRRRRTRSKVSIHTEDAPVTQVR